MQNFIHLRRIKNGILSNFGGMTICQDFLELYKIGNRDAVKLQIGIAVCSNKDRYIRKDGRRVSQYRLIQEQIISYKEPIEIVAKRNFQGSFVPGVLFNLTNTLRKRIKNRFKYNVDIKELHLYLKALEVLKGVHV